jgi:hypothetical protein
VPDPLRIGGRLATCQLLTESVITLPIRRRGAPLITRAARALGDALIAG